MPLSLSGPKTEDMNLLTNVALRAIATGVLGAVVGSLFMPYEA